MKTILCLIFTFSFIGAGAQVVPDEFGNVKPEYLSMTSYLSDDLAEAVVLYDFGKTYFTDSDYGFRIIFERTRKIKILKKAGIDYASVEVPYYVENSERETVYDIEGYTFSFENGSLRKTKLDPKSVFEEKINDHWMVKKWAMPDVSEGSVIEYRYKVISPYFVNLRDWEFQSKIPTIYSQYTVCMIPFYEYSYIFQGAKKFDVFKNELTSMKRNYAGVEYPDNNYTFGMKNIPAFRDEDFITSVNDYLMKIDFQLAVVHHTNGANVEYVTTWPLLNEKLLKDPDFGLFMKSATKNATEIIPLLSLESKTPREKAEIITSYVKANFNWDGYNSKFTGQTLKEFLKTKTGNVASVNLYLCAMLGAAGLDAEPVILSTRNNGKVPMDFPFQQFLNYVIAMVRIDGKPVLLDATEPLSPFGMLPARCINEKGLIVKKDAAEWIALTDESPSVESDSVRISFGDSPDSINVVVNINSTGHAALDYRRSFISDKNEFSNRWFAQDRVMKKAVSVSNEKEITKPFCFEYAATMPLETVNDKILVTPFPGLTPSENPLKISYRSYPVDMVYPKTNTFTAIIDIPKGYRVADVPKDINVDHSLVSITYKTEVLPEKVVVNGSYAFKKAVYYPAEYYNLKNLYTQIVQTFNNKIVLVKSN